MPRRVSLDIHTDFAAGSRFACPSCGAADCPAYDAEQMTWRHLNFFQHQAFLHARMPRVHCTGCGIKTLSVPWARPDSGFTLLFEALTMSLVSAMPVNAVALLVGEHDTRLWRVIYHCVDRARAKLDLSTVNAWTMSMCRFPYTLAGRVDQAISYQKSSTSPVRRSANRVTIRLPILSLSAAVAGSVRSTPLK